MVKALVAIMCVFWDVSISYAHLDPDIFAVCFCQNEDKVQTEVFPQTINRI